LLPGTPCRHGSCGSLPSSSAQFTVHRMMAGFRRMHDCLQASPQCSLQCNPCNCKNTVGRRGLKRRTVQDACARCRCRRKRRRRLRWGAEPSGSTAQRRWAAACRLVRAACASGRPNPARSDAHRPPLGLPH